MTGLKQWLATLPPETLVLLASVCAAVAMFVLVQGWLGGLGGPRKFSARGESFEDRRRDLLRQGNGLYRALEPLVDVFATFNRSRNPGTLTRLGREIEAAGIRLPWQPAEYMALRQLEGVLVGGMVALIFGLLGNVMAGLLLAVLAAWLYPYIALGDVGRKGRSRMYLLKERLPFAVDLMALMMEAGAGFTEALKTAVAESSDNPVAEEFGEVLRDTAMGRTRREAMLALQDRLGDRDITELVFAIVKGEEMGTPLAQILRSQADQMRLKRSQIAEKEAAEAQVTIMFPGLLVMIACILIITAPFILQLLNEKGGAAGLFG